MLETPSIRRYSFNVTPAYEDCDVSSDNSSGADNQQERPSSSSWLDAIPSDLGHYVAGFVDGEGSFNVPIRRERDRGLPWRVSLSFNVSQIGSEAPKLLQHVFAVGTVRGRRDGVFYFEVTSRTTSTGGFSPSSSGSGCEARKRTTWRSFVRSLCSSSQAVISRRKASRPPSR